MTTKLPRITGYVQPKTKARLHELSKDTGKPIGQILDEAVANISVSPKDWIAQQTGYQSLLAVALVSALAKERLGLDELTKVRDAAARAALQVFGPLGKRPFDVDAAVPNDERLLALFAAFNE